MSLVIIAEIVEKTAPAKPKKKKRIGYGMDVNMGTIIPAENQATAKLVKNSEYIFPLGITSFRIAIS